MVANKINKDIQVFHQSQSLIGYIGFSPESKPDSLAGFVSENKVATVFKMRLRLKERFATFSGTLGEKRPLCHCMILSSNVSNY